MTDAEMNALTERLRTLSPAGRLNHDEVRTVLDMIAELGFAIVKPKVKD